jgi:signal transduction histidine kinase/ActR/RegA family two-component response regulator
MKEPKDFIMPAASVRPEEMPFNPVTLSFQGDLEKAFLDVYYLNSLKVVRLALLAGILVYGLFGILDIQLIPEMRSQLWLIRYALVCPAILVSLLLSFTPLFRRYFQPALMVTMIIAGAGIIAMISIIPPPVNYFYYAGLILVLIWGYAFTRVRFIWATAGGWIIVALYEIVAVGISDTPFPILLNNNFFFISANLVGMFSCYSIEYYTRRDFFLAYLLEREQQKIESANVELERIVQERTSQLVEINKDLRLEIEERKKAEEKKAELEGKLQQAQRLEAMGTLAGGIAHDFNNILMGIQGYASLMLLDIDTTHPHFEKLKSTEQYVKRGAELTRQLLGFSRGGKYEVSPTNLNELVDKSAQLFGRTKKEISISTNFQADPWIAEVDKGQIEQVLLNLYVNAWQAMPAGGNLYLETHNVFLDEADTKPYGLRSGRYLKITVTDTGVGMDEKTKERIFEPFFTTKGMGRGTGLGLASAYGIVKSHNGIINVASKKGQGTTFNIYLPASDRGAVKERIVKETLMRGKETILLVDDEDITINSATEMLQWLGYSVLVAKGGREAIDKLQTHLDSIDLIILDMVMPGMGGRETYERLRVIRPDVKILLASGYSISGDTVRIMEEGCAGFIQKPFDITQISVKLREILDSGRQIPSEKVNSH